MEVPMGPWGRYPRNQWYVAAGGAELSGRPFARRLLGEDVVLFRTEEGTPVALADACPHRGASLSMGRTSGSVIACRYHGIEFNGSGECVHIPSQSSISKRMRARSFPLVEKWLWVWIWLGDPDEADPSTIPTSRAESMSGYHNSFFFAEPFACNAQLVQDNLLDSTHVPFVHDEILVGEVSDALREMAKPELRIDMVGGTMNAWRELPDYRPPAMERETLGLEDKPYRYRLTTEVTPPCMFTSCSEWYEQDGTPAVRLYYSLPIVPAGPRACYHFMGVSMPTPYEGPEILQYWQTIVRQDRDILEPLQAAADRSMSFTEVSVKADSAQLRYRRILAEMVSAEDNADATVST